MTGQKIQLKPITPLVKYAGGKRKIAARIAGEFPKVFDRYVEPFVGGGAVFCHLSSWNSLLGKRVRLSDTCQPLISLYRHVENHSTWKPLADHCRVLETEYNDFGADQRAAYYQSQREIFNVLLGEESFTQAARFLFLNRACFNGLWRTNSGGEFNVPRGKYALIALPTEEQIKAWHEALGQAVVSCASYDCELRDCGDGDAVYLDPPYDEGFDDYDGRNGFPWASQQRLAELARAAVDRGATVIASNRTTDRVLDLWSGYDFTITQVDVHHAIGAKANRRRNVAEMIAVGRPK